MVNLDNFKLLTKYINYNHIFLLADLHFGIRSNSLEWLDNQQSYFNNFYIPFLKENVKENDILFILGDTFDSRQSLDITILNSVISLIEKLSKIIPVHIIIGNHDCAKKYNTDVNSIIAFKYIPNVYIYEKPAIITNQRNKILLLPWIGNKETEENYIRTNSYDYIFAHADINGFKYDNGKEIKTYGVDFLQFKNIKRLFSGHIHKRQEFKNFIYIGSPYHTKRSDIGNTKGIYVFNPNDNTFTFTPNNYSPIFQRITLDGILELTLSEAINVLNNNYTDIILPDKYINLFNLTKFIDLLKDCNYKKIETSNESKKLDEELLDTIEGVDIGDILSLLELGINELGHKTDVLIKLKSLNKKYYENANKEDLI